MSMRECNLYKPMIKGAAEEGWHLFHPQEGVAKAPFDLCGVFPYEIVTPYKGNMISEFEVTYGIAVAVEVKVQRTPRRPESPLPWGSFATHQITWLKQFAGARALAIAAIYYEPAGELVAYVLRCGSWTESSSFDPVVSCEYIPHITLPFNKSAQMFTGWTSLIPLWES